MNLCNCSTTVNETTGTEKDNFEYTHRDKIVETITKPEGVIFITTFNCSLCSGSLLYAFIYRYAFLKWCVLKQFEIIDKDLEINV